MKLSSCLAFIFGVLMSSQAFASETCNWFSSNAAPNYWWMLHGKCQIEIKDGKFTALLYDDEIPDFLRMKVNGVINANRVKAKVEIENSDAGIDELQGTLTSNNFFKNVFILTNNYNTLGIKLN